METQKIMAGLVSNRIVYLQFVFLAFALDYYMSCNDRTEVIQKQPGPDFHFNIIGSRNLHAA